MNNSDIPRHVTEIKGRFYFRATKAMRQIGIFNEPLGEDRKDAVARALFLNDEWDRLRAASKVEPIEHSSGGFTDLIDRFQKDPTWYGDRAPATREEMDYVFKIVAQIMGQYPVRIMQRRHSRALYNKIRAESSVHKARKVMKWTHRLMEYAIEIGLRDDNPTDKLRMEAPKGRNQVWTTEEISAVIKAAQKAGKHPKSGNHIPARPSVALATQLAYNLGQRQQDILALKWSQYDGEGISLVQKKTGKALWLPLTEDSIAMLEETDKTSTYIVVSEETKQPYSDRNVFSRIFRRFRDRAEVRSELTFMDLRRTAATELGNKGATNAEIVAFTGHEINSRVVGTYVKPDKLAARRAAIKRKAD
jgi:integrase